jgi:hypothetical protein
MFPARSDQFIPFKNGINNLEMKCATSKVRSSEIYGCALIMHEKKFLFCL